MYIYAYLLYSVKTGKPTFCLASFVAQADMNFPSVFVLLNNIRTTYSIHGVEMFYFSTKSFLKSAILYQAL